MKQIITVFFAGILALGFFSCRENSLEKQRQNELKKLNEFMRAHYGGKDPRPSGLYYFQLEEGTGDSIKIGDRVQIFHEIMTLDSIVVRATGRYEPLEIFVSPPNQLGSSASSVNELRALHEALTYMKRGSKSLLIFDSSLGFGQFGASGIVGFTPLMMEVEVYKVYPAQPQEEVVPE
jgi:hypothetical protein